MHRLELLKKLGYALKPVDLSDERRIWRNINYKFAFPDQRTYPDLPYEHAQCFTFAEPGSIIYKTERTVVQEPNDDIKIYLIIHNKCIHIHGKIVI